MPQYSSDSVINVIYQQVKEPIRLCVAHHHFSACVKLIYSGIDTMAYLGMPNNQTDVARTDFVSWVDRYLNFPGREQLTGWDVYGARCSMLHNHSVYSSLSRKGKCRLVGYTSEMYPPVKYRPDIKRDLVLVSVPALADAFFDGVNICLVDLFSNSDKKDMAEKRLKSLVHNLTNRSEADENSENEY